MNEILDDCSCYNEVVPTLYDMTYRCSQCDETCNILVDNTTQNSEFKCTEGLLNM